MIYILLPAYNEELDIGRLLARIEQVLVATKLPIQILVVNDGSKDNTVGVVQSFTGRIPFEILEHGENKGLGQAMLTGLTRAAELSSSAQQTLLNQAKGSRESLAGVNLDEEAANLIMFQQAYQASAQSISVAKSLFDTLIGAVR